jgi:hypothetical protein
MFGGSLNGELESLIIRSWSALVCFGRLHEAEHGSVTNSQNSGIRY